VAAKKSKRKKTARKKPTRRKTARRRSGSVLDAIDRELADLSKQIDRRLAPLRREIERAERQVGTEAAKQLRRARRQLDQVTVTGHSDWKKFLRGSKRDLSRALGQLERSVRPVAKKKAAGKKKAVRKKAARRTATA
jgi:hypothetical protein